MSSIVLDRIQVAQAQFPASLIHVLSLFPEGGREKKTKGKERSFQTSIRVRGYFLPRYKFPERLLDSTCFDLYQGIAKFSNGFEKRFEDFRIEILSI